MVFLVFLIFPLSPQRTESVIVVVCMQLKIIITPRSSLYPCFLFVSLYLIVVCGMKVRAIPRVGVSFSPAGLLTPFHLGASKQLQEYGILTPKCAIAGASGGALAAATSALLDHSSLKYTPLEASVYVAQQCRDLGGLGTLQVALHKILDQLIPENGHELLNSRPASVTIAYTEVLPTAARGILNRIYQPHLVHKFRSKQDIIEVLCASCNIPFYFSGKTVAIQVREHKAIDGFFAVDFRRFGSPPTHATKHELIICPFTKRFAKIVPHKASSGYNVTCNYHIITPDLLAGNMREFWPFSIDQLFRMAITAPLSTKAPHEAISNEELVEKYEILYRAGQECVRRWYAQSGEVVRQALVEEEQQVQGQTSSVNIKKGEWPV
jgi:hypothetical protein